MPKRIKDYASAATTIASDDYFAIDGATNGTRKTLLTAFGTTGILFGAGTAAAPKLAVGTSSNGIYAPSGNTLGFSTNGAQQWRIDSFGTLVSDVQSTPVLRFQPALPGTTCGVEWFDTGAVLAAYTKYNVTSPQLEINAGKSGSTGRIVFYTNTTDVGRFTSSQCFLVGTTSETGLTGAAGMKVASTTLATSGSTGALVVAGSAGFGKKCFITDGSTGAQLRLEYTAASVYTDLATLSTGHFLMTTTGGNRITSTTTNDTSVLARQVQGGLAFDGVTTTASDVHTIGSDIGTSDMSLSVTFSVPTTNPSVISGIAYLSSSSTSGNVARALYLSLTTNGDLYVVLNGSTSSLYVYKTTPIVSIYGGKVINVTCVKNVTASTMTVYINGVALTLSDNNSTTPPTWADTILSTYFNLGRLTTSFYNYAGSIFGAQVFNRALSASEVVTLANQGVSEADKWGSLTAIVGPSTLNGGFETAGGGGADVFANWNEVLTGATVLTQEADARPGSTGTKSMKIVRTNSADATTVQQSVSLVAGKRYRVTFWGKTASSGRVNIATPYSSTMDQVLTTSWAQYQGAVFTATATTTANLQIYMTSGTTGDYYIDDIEFNQVGSILDADLTAGVGYQVPDRSSNKYHGVVSATGTSWTLPQRRGQLRVSTSNSGNNQLLGAQVCLPTNAIITSIVGYTTGTPTVYLGNVSNGSQLVASVAMSASTYTSFTLAATTTTTTTGNVWANVSSAVTVNWTITYMIADP